jgi:hypothetical protein
MRLHGEVLRRVCWPRLLYHRLEVFHDLQQQRYLVNGLDNERGAWRFSEGSDLREFSPNALSYDVR